MLSKPQLLSRFIFPLTLTLSAPAFAQVTNFGNITDSSATYTNFLATNILGIIQVNPEDILFSFNQNSNLDIDFTTFVNLDIGGKFELSKVGGGYSAIFSPPLLSLAGSYAKSFSNLAAGNYSFKYIPSAFSLGLSTNITFKATTVAVPVPEPGNTAMLFSGLALIGIALRKKMHNHGEG